MKEFVSKRNEFAREYAALITDRHYQTLQVFRIIIYEMTRIAPKTLRRGVFRALHLFLTVESKESAAGGTQLLQKLL